MFLKSIVMSVVVFPLLMGAQSFAGEFKQILTCNGPDDITGHLYDRGDGTFEFTETLPRLACGEEIGTYVYKTFQFEQRLMVCGGEMYTHSSEGSSIFRYPRSNRLTLSTGANDFVEFTDCKDPTPSP